MSRDGDFPAVSDEADEKSLKSLIQGKKRPLENGAVWKPVAAKKEEPRREEDEDEGDIGDKPLAALGNGGRVIKEEPLGENGKEGRALGRKKKAKVKKEERVEEEEELEEMKVFSKGRKVTTTIEKKASFFFFSFLFLNILTFRLSYCWFVLALMVLVRCVGEEKHDEEGEEGESGGRVEG